MPNLLAAVVAEGAYQDSEIQRWHARSMTPAEAEAWIEATVATAWAFDRGLHRVHLEHSVGNPASCRVAERAGFTLEGTQRSAALHLDGWHDMHLHARVAR